MLYEVITETRTRRRSIRIGRTRPPLGSCTTSENRPAPPATVELRCMSGILLGPPCARNHSLVADPPRIEPRASVPVPLGPAIPRITSYNVCYTKLLRKRGILVCNFPGMNNLTVAEHTIAMIMALSKQLIHMHHAVKSGNWNELV